MRRGYWFVITGLILGVLGGLAYSWLVDPVRFTEIAPFMLNESSKDEYRSLVAASYAATGDLGRATARLKELGDQDPGQSLAAQAQRTVAGQGSYTDARALALLAVAVSQANAVPTGAETSLTAATPSAAPAETQPTTLVIPPASSPVATQTSPAASPLTNPTRQPTAAPTPSPTVPPPYVVAQSGQICNASLPPALLTVQVVDSAGQPVPGVQVIVTWSGGEDVFYTGLKPGFGPGYADFDMTAGVNYSLRLAEGGQPVSGISVGECPAEGGNPAYPSGWEVLFKQP